MNILRILYHLARRADRRWALRQVDPMNPDVTKLVLSERHHDDQLRALNWR